MSKYIKIILDYYWKLTAGTMDYADLSNKISFSNETFCLMVSLIIKFVAFSKSTSNCWETNAFTLVGVNFGVGSIIGPFFIENKTGIKSKWCSLSQHNSSGSVSELQDMVVDDMWFQHDGATQHTVRETIL